MFVVKRFTIICILIFFVSTLQAQSRKYYCEIKGIEKEMSAGLKIVFDFGESPVYSIWGSLKSKQKLVDENGKEIKFYSMVDKENDEYSA